MFTSISWIGVVLATLSSFIVGSIWYSPAGFLKPWMKITGTTDADMKQRFAPSMVAIGVASLITAVVLAYAMQGLERVTGVSGLSAGLETSLWIWLGFVVTTIVSTGVLEPRSSSVLVIYAGNRLVTLVVMGLILGLFK